VQRAVEIDEVQIKANVAPSAPAPAPPASTASAPGTTAASAAPAAAVSPAQDPEQLREQVLRWVRAELLVNRERAGRLTDLR
jgi:hypothetical protein